MKNVILIFCFFSSCLLSASPVTKVASFDGTIEPGGPSGSPWFHNAQVAGSFEEYAISSYLFTPADFGLTTVTSVSSASISYMQNNAFFTTDGPLEFFVSFDATVGGGDYSSLYHDSLVAPTGIDDNLFSDNPSTASVGTATFTEVSNGHVDIFTLSFSGATETALVNAINNNTPFSILMTAPSGSTAATFAGLQSNSFVINGGNQPDSSRTSLTLDAIPEPSTFLVLILSFAGLKIYFRNRT